MRQKFTPQMSLFAHMAGNSIVKELEGMSGILDANPKLLDLVCQDMIKSIPTRYGQTRPFGSAGITLCSNQTVPPAHL